MGYAEATIIAMVSTVIQDPGTATFGTALIAGEMRAALREMSDITPQSVFGTVTFASTARELSISGTAFADLLEVDDVEYAIGKEPRAFRTFERRKDTLLVDISFTPATGDTAYIWFSAPHSVSGTTVNTLDPTQERILVEMTAGKIAMNHSFGKVNKVLDAGSWVDFQNWGERKYAKALQDLRRLAKPKMTIRWPTVA